MAFCRERHENRLRAFLDVNQHRLAKCPRIALDDAAVAVGAANTADKLNGLRFAVIQPGVGSQNTRLRPVFFGLDHLRDGQRAGNAPDLKLVIVGHCRAGQRRRVLELLAERAAFR